MFKRIIIMMCVALCAAYGNAQGGNATRSSVSKSKPATATINTTLFPAKVVKACKGVNVTTPLAKTPQACQNIWGAYGVTEVPPIPQYEER